MASTLNGRIARLEAAIVPDSDRCRACGLRHVQPLTIALLRGVLRLAVRSDLQRDSPALLCLCHPCCGAPGDRWFARRSHGIPADTVGRETLRLPPFGRRREPALVIRDEPQHTGSVRGGAYAAKPDHPVPALSSG